MKIIRVGRGHYRGLSRGCEATMPFAMKKARIPHGRYLGGLAYETNPTSRKNTSLLISDEGIGVGLWKPIEGNVAWSQMWGISFDGALGSQSRVGATVTDDNQDRAELAVQLSDGTVALYRVLGMSGATLRERLQSAMTEKGVRCLDDHH